MAQQASHNYRSSITLVKRIKNTRRKTSLHESGNELSVHVTQRKSLPRKKRHRSLSQVVPIKEVLTDTIPIWEQNVTKVGQNERRSAGRLRVTNGSKFNSSTNVIPVNFLNSSHRPRKGDTDNSTETSRPTADSLPILPIQPVSQLSDQFDAYPADKKTDLSTSVKPRKFESKPKQHNDLPMKKKVDRLGNQLQRGRKNKCCVIRSCSPLLAILSMLVVTLLLTGLSALFVGLFASHQVTTRLTTISTPISYTTTTVTTTTTTITKSTSTSTTTTTTTFSTTTLLTSTSTTITTTTTCSPIFASNSSLVAYFPMDSSPSYLTDVGASLTATALSVTSIAGERNEALSFMGTHNSYFQISNLLSLGTPNNPFSIALYISPNVLAGTIVHISMYSSVEDHNYSLDLSSISMDFFLGNGGWCLPFVGFASTTQLAIQVWGGSTARYVLGPIPPLNSWTHVVQTWSSGNGLTLYINGALYAQDSTVTTYAASSVADYLTLASTIQILPYASNACSTTGVLGGLGYYNGSIDELRVYSRELSGLEVCALAKY